MHLCLTGIIKHTILICVNGYTQHMHFSLRVMIKDTLHEFLFDRFN